MPASSEFVALCRSQVQVIKELGAALSAVYLTEEWVEGEEAKLIPVIVYPQTGGMWEEHDILPLLPDETDTSDPMPWLLSEAPIEALTPLNEAVDAPGSSPFPEETDHSLLLQQRIVLPLMHEGVVMGLLVTGREDRPWNEWERSQIEQIAHTMAIACVLDQRRAWLEQRLSQHQRLQSQQNDLLHNLLHQLRSPLTALRTFGKLLLKRLGVGDANRDIASNILRESDRIQELLQQVDQAIELTASEERTPLSLPTADFTSSEPKKPPGNQPLLLLPEAGLAALPLASFAVMDVLEPLLASASAIAQDRNLDLQVDIFPDLPPVRGNAAALREVLSNLIDNALKYTPAGGRIYIQIGLVQETPQGNLLGISVSDNGPGIPPQDLEHLFERHYRGVQAQTEIAGTGLGLAIARALVEQMQGEIQVFSPAQNAERLSDGGQGVTFIVGLPTAS